MDVVSKYCNIKKNILILNKFVNLVVVTKSQRLDHIKKLINLGHFHFGENKVQEAKEKWANVLHNNKDLKLHLIGKLQSNKVKDAFALFDFIHTLDNEKLAKIFSNLEKISEKNLKYFIQVNIGHEEQKNGIDVSLLSDFVNFCRDDLSLNIIGLMCIPPINEDSLPFFKKMQKLKIDNNLSELSMGMSSDYQQALVCGSTYLRIGSAIFK